MARARQRLQPRPSIMPSPGALIMVSMAAASFSCGAATLNTVAPNSDANVYLVGSSGALGFAVNSAYLASNPDGHHHCTARRLQCSGRGGEPCPPGRDRAPIRKRVWIGEAETGDRRTSRFKSTCHTRRTGRLQGRLSTCRRALCRTRAGVDRIVPARCKAASLPYRRRGAGRVCVW